MRIINKRYEIKNKIQSLSGLSEYIILDQKDNKSYKLLIFGNDIINENIKKYLINNFQSIKNFNFEGVYSIYDLLSIKEIDGITLEKMQYGFISECGENEVNLIEYLESVDEGRVIECIFKLMCIINTINLKGFSYSNLKLEDIKINCINQKGIIKLPNILTSEISKIDSIFMKHENIDHLNSRAILNNKSFNMNELVKMLEEIIKILKDKKYIRLKEISIAINNIEKNKVVDINGLIESINTKLFNKNVKFLKETVEKLEEDIDIVGRDLELENIMGQYEEIIEGRAASKAIIFDGAMGVGKTKILKEIQKRLEYRYSTSIFSVVKKDKEVILESNNCAKEFNYTRSFRKEFKKFMEEFSKKLTRGYSISSNEDFKETYKMINQGVKLFDEHTRITPLVLIIDDLEKKNRVAKIFLRQIIENLKTLSNIMVIITVDKNTENEEFKEYYNEIVRNKSVSEYKLEMLNKFYTKEIVERTLNTATEVNEIVDVIYKDTIGNPKLIAQKIDDMYKYKNIFITKQGVWKYKKTRFAINTVSWLEGKYVEKIENLSFFENSVLKKLAAYDFLIKENIFLENVIITLKEKEAYYDLKKQNVIVESYDDNGINIDFKDYFYKKIIYKKMAGKAAKAEHSKFSNLLLNSIQEQEEKYPDLIYHLEMAERTEELIKYTKEYKQILILKGNLSGAIKFYEKILNYLSDGEKVEVAYEIGSIYEKMEADTEALKFYKLANENALKLKHYSYIIESSLNIARLNIEQENYKEAFDNMNTAKVSLMKTNYKLGYAKYFLIKAIYLKYIENKEESIEFANRALAICLKENYAGIIGDVYLLLFRYAFQDRNYEEAEKYVGYCEKIFEKKKDGKKYYETLINRISLLTERDKNVKVANRKLSKILEESTKNKMTTIKYHALIQMANLNIYKNKISKAEDALISALEVIKVNKNLKRYLISVYEYLLYIKAIKREFGELIKYKNILLEMDNKCDKEFIYGLYYYALGDFSKLRNETKLDKKKRVLYGYRSLSFEMNLINIVLLNSEEKISEELKGISKKLKEQVGNKYYSNRMMEIAILLNKLGFRELSKKIFEHLEETIDFSKLEEKTYLISINEFKAHSSNYLINRCNRLINNIPNSIEKVELYYLIAQNYEKTNAYVLAFENYYEGLIIISNYIKQERIEDRRKILASEIFYNFLERFLYCANEKLGIGLEINTFMKTDLEIESFIDQIKVSKMLKNDKFKNVIMDKYEKTYLNNYKDANTVLCNFKDDVIHNIESIMKYIIRITLSTSAVLILKNGDKDEVIYSYRGNCNEKNSRILNKKINIEYFIVNNEEMTQNEIYSEILPQNIKSCLYKKIKRKYGEGNSYKNIEGELILMSDKLINNINEESYEKINEYENILMFLLDQYKITISSTRDKLTGAFNRGYFEKTMDNIIRDFNYEEKIFSVIIFDIDNFKGINDKFGHQTGDMVLERISEIVKEGIENKDIFSRYGGEEFVVICPGEDEKSAFEKADILRKKIEDENILRGRREVTVSLGVATYPKHSKKKEELIQKADQALYAAKRGTKNIVKIWNENLDVRVESTDRLAGIITGSTSVDYERIASIVEIIDVVKAEMGKEFKIYKILKKILKITNGKECVLFKVENNKPNIEMAIVEKEEGWKKKVYYNAKILENVISTKKGMYDIDWDEVISNISITPKLNSLCIIPILNNKGNINAVIYISVPIKRKEFDFKDYNYINTLGNILAILF